MVQARQGQDMREEDLLKIVKIGALGSVENGAVMVYWYTFLNNFIGSGGAPKIVLLKCLMDQLFYATQADFMFLALCAYHNAGDMNLALNEVKETFISTWLMDCSIWPIVNFVGFSFMPLALQPTYMACVQFFWQIYISTVASRRLSVENKNLKEIFDSIDLDKVRFFLLYYILNIFSNKYFRMVTLMKMSY